MTNLERFIIRLKESKLLPEDANIFKSKIIIRKNINPRIDDNTILFRMMSLYFDKSYGYIKSLWNGDQDGFHHFHHLLNRLKKEIKII
jgi:hypothetical protein